VSACLGPTHMCVISIGGLGGWSSQPVRLSNALLSTDVHTRAWNLDVDISLNKLIFEELAVCLNCVLTALIIIILNRCFQLKFQGMTMAPHHLNSD
jgi:hypothetical protein